eukprot:s1274_g10.t1
MAESRPAKLARLQSLQRTVPYVSKSALSAILQDVATKGVPPLHSHKHILESTKMALQQAGAKYGNVLQQWPVENVDGSTGHLWLCNFWTYLYALCWEGGSYRDLLHRTAQACGMSEEKPMQLCVYTDEVIPGNILGKCERRTWAIYCSFMDFSLKTLGSEYAWILLACVKSSTIAKMNAGIGQVMALVLKSIFFNPLCPAEGGVLLPCKDGHSMRLYVKLHAILQDGSGHKYTYNAKGDSGWKYCLLCSAHGKVVAAADEDCEEGEDASWEERAAVLLTFMVACFSSSVGRIDVKWLSGPWEERAAVLLTFMVACLSSSVGRIDVKWLSGPWEERAAVLLTFMVPAEGHPSKHSGHHPGHNGADGADEPDARDGGDAALEPELRGSVCSCGPLPSESTLLSFEATPQRPEAPALQPLQEEDSIGITLQGDGVDFHGTKKTFQVIF